MPKTRKVIEDDKSMSDTESLSQLLAGFQRSIDTMDFSMKGVYRHDNDSEVLKKITDSIVDYDKGMVMHHVIERLRDAGEEFEDLIEICNALLCACACALSNVNDMPVVARHFQRLYFKLGHKILSGRLKIVERSVSRRKDEPKIAARKIALEMWSKNPAISLDEMAKTIGQTSHKSLTTVRDYIRDLNPNKGKKGRPKKQKDGM
ncbi:hypothetical protein ACE02H_14770 [Shewanella mangrovisoli]|uniref:hypothetical protein n=1 Tax=Shewanella mangrovisoli TaxID=2864211 RepID=UPI0035B70F95